VHTRLAQPVGTSVIASCNDHNLHTDTAQHGTAQNIMSCAINPS
jgi:hypothetical protein